MRITDAFKAFFAVLGGKELVPKGSEVPPKLTEQTPIQKQPEPKPAAPVVTKPVQSEAIALLAALQREARLVDFLMEPLGSFSDAQVGAAARSVHDDAAKMLKRIFDLKPLREETEEATVEIAKPDAALYTLSGNVGGSGPFRGTLQHAGWKAGRCELPSFNGTPEAAMVIAPAEIEVR